MFLRELFEKEREKSKTLEASIFFTLRKAIHMGYLYPGEKLVENELARKIGVSRTPIRAAILRLERDKLIVNTPQKGAKVAKLSPVEVEEGYMVMGVLQGFAAYLAISNLDDGMICEMEELQSQLKSKKLLEEYSLWLQVNNKFHNVFINASDNPHLVHIIRENLGRLTRYWYLACSFGFLKKSIYYHDQIVEYIKRKDKDNTRRIVEEHFFETGKDVRNYLEKIMI